MFRKFLFIFGWIVVMANPAYPATLKIACAANFTAPMKILAEKYEAATGDTVQCTFGSTGMLYGQIINSAPYDIFFAADEKRPALLYKDGLSLAPAPYAKGTVVLWSPKKELADKADWKAVVTAPEVSRIGIALPKAAPYGAKAMGALADVGLTSEVSPKLAYGKSVGTAFQYAYTGAADASFVALSQTLSDKGINGKYWAIPEAGKVNQAVCILKRADTESAMMFVHWLDSKVAQIIIKKYGYE